MSSYILISKVKKVKLRVFIVKEAHAAFSYCSLHFSMFVTSTPRKFSLIAEGLGGGGGRGDALASYTVKTQRE
jgi:hypothetical protein